MLTRDYQVVSAPISMITQITHFVLPSLKAMDFCVLCD
uniref:Uncharacterized protein n=1 Tax=Tetranychus urticae TaxID=32264 RepID=T1JYK2_TETUR